MHKDTGYPAKPPERLELVKVLDRKMPDLQEKSYVVSPGLFKKMASMLRAM